MGSCAAMEAFSAEEQLRIFRLRFTPLKMTTVFWYQEASVYERVDASGLPAYILGESCFLRRTDADLSTALRSAQDDNGVLFRIPSVWTSSGVRLSCIYRAPFGTNYLQSGRIYFEGVKRLLI